MGGQPPPAHELTRFIGPPLRTTLGELLATDDPARIGAAVDHYRERFAAAGMFENAVYDDVPGALDRLRAHGHRLWLVTSKPEVYARTIVTHFGLAHHFTALYGSELSGERADKGDLIAHVLARERLAREDVWMIGDRAHDVAGGRRNGVRTMGVLWGYGSEDELRAAGADALVASMEELHERLCGRSAYGPVKTSRTS